MALASGVQFEEDETRTFGESYVKSKKTNAQFLDYIPTLLPAKTSEIISLNDARKRVVFMAPVLAATMENIRVFKLLLKL